MNLRRAMMEGDREAVVALQHRAYARNRAILGVEPIPLMADYADIFATMDVWMAESERGDLDGVLILQARDDDLLIWSVATDPDRQAKGVGRDMLQFAEHRARMLERTTLRLYTGTPLVHLVDWYMRHGYATERIEQQPDRSITHMVKRLA